MPSPAESYTLALQRIEAGADRRTAGLWRLARRDLADVVDRHNPQSPVLLSALAGAVLAAARQMPITSTGRAIYEAAERLVSAQTGAPAPDVEAPAMSYEPWRLAATGIFMGEALRMQAAGADEAAMRARLITGRDGRSSAWELARNSLALAVALMVWGGGNGLVVRMATVAAERDDIDYQKQAIAALDARTTRICRAVNRQIQPLDRPFRTIVGHQMNPPFHHRCRTAVVLYHPSFDKE